VKEGREEEQREEQGAEEETGCNRTCRQESGGAFTIRSRVFSGATLRSFASQDLPSPPSPSRDPALAGDAFLHFVTCVYCVGRDCVGLE
jgi:hypothetical protein